MTRHLVALVALALALPGCSLGGGSAEDALAQTADKLGEIRSGTLDFAILVTPREGEPFGFELRGPFALAERQDALPELEIDYTQIAEGERATVTLISTGERAYGRVGEEVEQLTEAQAQELRGITGAFGGREGLVELPLDDWIVDPELEDGGEVGGAETDRVTGELDVVAAVNGLVGLARGLGRDLERIEGANAERLRESTRSTLFELHTGKDDRLLRRLRMEADFGFDVPAELREALGELVGAKVEFRFGVTDPNRPVDVQDPER